MCLLYKDIANVRKTLRIFVILKYKKERGMIRIMYLYSIATVLCLAACHESMDERAGREAHDFTAKNCPVEIAPGFILDSLTFDKRTRTVNYHFIMCGAMDNARIDSAKARKTLLLALVNAPNLRIYKKAGFTFRYTYRSEKDSGRIKFDFILTPDEYNAANPF